MTTLSLKISDSIHKQIKSLTERDHISMNQFISSALSEKISAYMTEEYIAKKAKRVDKEKFHAALSKVPDISPDTCGKL